MMLCLIPAQGCSDAEDKREALAVKGKVQEDAPVKAAAEVAIHAPADKVWALLSSIGDWPKWQANVSKVEVNGAVAPGTVFLWKNGGTNITSRLALVEPQKRIVWTGTAMGAHAVHVWTLEALPEGRTLVKTTESMDGFMLKRFYNSEELAESLRVWLAALKKKAEEGS